jgi:hypothetical protein
VKPHPKTWRHKLVNLLIQQLFAGHKKAVTTRSVPACCALTASSSARR